MSIHRFLICVPVVLLVSCVRHPRVNNSPENDFDTCMVACNDLLEIKCEDVKPISCDEVCVKDGEGIVLSLDCIEHVIACGEIETCIASSPDEYKRYRWAY